MTFVPCRNCSDTRMAAPPRFARAQGRDDDTDLLIRSRPLTHPARGFCFAKLLSCVPNALKSHVMQKPGIGVKSPLDGL